MVAFGLNGLELRILGGCPSTDILLAPSRWEARPTRHTGGNESQDAFQISDMDVSSMAFMLAMAEAIESLLADIAVG